MLDPMAKARDAYLSARRSGRLFVEIELDHAEELLEELLPQTGQRWVGAQAEEEWDWMYRGQADAKWSLTPAAFRPGALFPFRNTMGSTAEWPDPKNDAHRRWAELYAVETFATYIDDQGIEVPGDTAELRDVSDDDVPSALNFPPVAQRPMFALAQHCGIPTRLLDWSQSSLTAAYFACLGVAKQNAEGRTYTDRDRFAVWALSRKFIDEALRRRDVFVQIVTAPGVSNANLLAQSGYFTLVGFRKEARDAGLPPDLDKVISELPGDVLPEAQLRQRAPFLYKYTVPYREARVLLRLLALNRVSAASLFPGGEGAVAAMRERQWHQQARRQDRR